MKYLNQKGLGLIELLVVILVIIILIGLAFISYRLFEKRTELEVTAQNVLVTLKLAQTKTLASEGASQYSVHFENNKYILFKGDTYQEGAVENKTYQLPRRLEIYDIDLADEGNDVIFQRISGHTQQNGAIRLRIISAPERTRTIIIQSYGLMELKTDPSNPPPDPITDSKHLHFDLGWSIQDSVILTLNFPDDPVVVIDIEMADYFRKSKTEFDWRDEIDVNGENQELHIHTHLLDAFNTILCIHRDREKNNKPLQVLIDDKDIVSYEADGTASVGAYGGTVEVQ